MNRFPLPRRPDPGSDPESERKFRRVLFIVGGLFLALVLAAVYSVLMATGAFGAAPVTVEETTRIEGFQAGEIIEPPTRILTTLGGRETILLPIHGKPVAVPVEALKLVAPRAVQTKVGVCAGAQAVRQGNARTRNRAFYRNPRIACAAFTAYCARKCGRTGLSFGAHAQYNQLRKRGGRLVASRASTRYAPFYPYWKRGDYLFFWKSGNRIGHVEICVGGGWTVGTSSSAGYVARRRVGNRGYRTMSVVRL